MLEKPHWSERRIKKLKDSIFDVKKKMAVSFNQEGSKCTFTFPNFDTLDALPKMIELNGPPFWSSTGTFELTHAYLRELKRQGNNKGIDKAILLHDSRVTGLSYSSQQYDFTTPKLTYQKKNENDFVGKPRPHRISAKDNQVLRVSSDDIKMYPGIFLCGHICRVGTSLEVEYVETPDWDELSSHSLSSEESQTDDDSFEVPLIIQRNKKKVYITMTSIFQHSDQKWIKAKLLSVQKSQHNCLFARLSKTIFIPVGDQRWMLGPPVHVVADPNSKDANRIVINLWQKKLTNSLNT